MKKALHFLSRFKEVLMAVCMMILWILLYVQTYSIKALATTDGLGPAFAPRVVLGCLMFMTLLIMIRESAKIIRTARTEAASNEAEASSIKKETIKGFLATASIIAFILLLRPLGFIIASILYVISQIYLIGDDQMKKPWFNIVLAVVIVVLIYLFFKKVTYIALPSGILSFI